MSERKPREKAFTNQQMKQISHNVNILLEQCSMTYEQLCEKSELSENTIKSIRTYEYKPSSTIPSRRSITKLANAFVEYYGYGDITTETLIKKDFATVDFSKNRKLRQKQEWYEGIYYAYSISSTRTQEENCLQYSILRIYFKNNHLRCSLLVHKGKEFHVQAEKYIKAGFSFEDMFEKLKKDFYQENRTLPFVCYEDEIIFSVDSAITINFIGDENSHTRCITFRDSYEVLKKRLHHFESATGIMLASPRAFYPAIAQLVTISFERKSDAKVKKLLTDHLQSFMGGFLYFY